MSTISFILPAYKRRFLHEAIASILAQTYRDFELVVVDDCSPEDLKSVVDGFHDERLSYHRNDENIGGKDLVAAWMKALEYATGEWVVLASDDDVYLPRFLEEVRRLQGKYPRCDLFHARSVEIDAEGRWSGVGLPRAEFESQVEFAYARAVLRMNQWAPDFLFRRSALQAMGGFVNFPIGTYSDDATWMVLAANGCVHTREVAFCFRMSGVNLSTPSDDRLLVKLDACRRYARWFAEFSKRLMPADAAERWMWGRIAQGNELEVSRLQWWLIDQARDWQVIRRALVEMGCGRRAIWRKWLERHPRLRRMLLR